jgi:hypothetical protein
MRIRRDQRQRLEEIFREEMDAAYKRIQERLAEIETQPLKNRGTGGGPTSIRGFYEDLTEKQWTDSDEQCLESLSDLNPGEVKRLIRDAYRRSLVFPIPSFKYLMNLARKNERAAASGNDSLRNADAISAIERERLANFLADHLKDAAEEIIGRLELSDKKGVVVREQLEEAQGSIIARFSPLV